MLAGYGRAPVRSLIPSVTVVAQGWLVFRDKSKMYRTARPIQHLWMDLHLAWCICKREDTLFLGRQGDAFVRPSEPLTPL
jgi:hypothetical protein